VCNLYSITKSQAAIIAFTRAMRDTTGNLPPLPGIFPDYLAPIVRNAPDGVRELVMARWGMPGPPAFRDDYGRHEPGLLFSTIRPLRSKRPSPLQELRARNAMPPRCRRDLPRRLQALQHDLELLVLGPATPPTCIHDIEPPDMCTVRMTVHTHSSQHRPSP
jgi:hypothetical protein